MLAEVGGTFKLGIQFVNWGKLDDSYFHPFGNYGYEFDGVAFHQIWHKFRKHGDPRPLYLFNVETWLHSTTSSPLPIPMREVIFHRSTTPTILMRSSTASI